MLSVLIMIAGLVAIAVPFIAGLTVTLIGGWMPIFDGVRSLAARRIAA